ncbi:MAG: hypothetical protein J6K58_06730 [Lachnospiraceae bacterium]|nr:hypothetical protein [Lachnospiraceae bacterium]MBP3458886.1 hypothetical protein [Lachnospiraceae bacterium]
MQKCIYLSEEDRELLKEYRQELGLHSDSQAISYLIRHSKKQNEELAVAIREELEKNYLPKERIKWATKVAEQNSIVLLDAMNTLMHMLKAETCISVELAPHPVVAQSQERIKEKIAYFKQKSDERKNKGK